MLTIREQKALNHKTSIKKKKLLIHKPNRVTVKKQQTHIIRSLAHLLFVVKEVKKKQQRKKKKIIRTCSPSGKRL
jgi:hypothetical protein